jgi:hypothetical protein
MHIFQRVLGILAFQRLLEDDSEHIGAFVRMLAAPKEPRERCAYYTYSTNTH